MTSSDQKESTTMQASSNADVTDPNPSTKQPDDTNAKDAEDDKSAKKLQSETSAEEQDTSDGGSRKPYIQLLTGMKEDLAARIPLYRDDWKRPKSLFTVGNAVFFAFVVQLIPALIFAELLDKQTEGSLAVAEVVSFLFQCVCARFNRYSWVFVRTVI